jgi:hypothetical protein
MRQPFWPPLHAVAKGKEKKKEKEEKREGFEKRFCPLFLFPHEFFCRTIYLFIFLALCCAANRVGLLASMLFAFPKLHDMHAAT